MCTPWKDQSIFALNPGGRSALAVLQVKLQLVGFDAVLLVEGRELAYVKLLDVDAFISTAAKDAEAAGAATKLTVAVTAGDIALRDLQVGFTLSGTILATLQ